MDEINKTEKVKENDPRFVLWLVVGIFFLGAAFYFSGFRLEDNLHLALPGVIEISGLPEESDVFLDEAAKAKVKKGKDMAVLRLVPAGAHTVSIFKEDFWPWQKPVEVKSGERLKLRPFLVSKNPTGAVITETDPEYEKIVSLIKEQSSRQAVKSADGQITLLKEGNELKARFEGNLLEAPPPFCEAGDCLPEVIIFSAESEVRAVDFYKGRNDVALIAVGNGLLAVEIDNVNFQNVQPVYKGKSPAFAVSQAGALLVSDSGAVMEINW